MAAVDQGGPDGHSQPGGAKPSNSELVVGLVGALGSDLPGVAQSIRTTLNDVFSYSSEILTVSSTLARFNWPYSLDLSREDERIKAHMDAGRDLNREWCETWAHHDALVRLSLLQIADERGKRNSEQGHTEKDRPLDRFAFILRSFKASR